MHWQNDLQDVFVNRLHSFFLDEERGRIVHSKMDGDDAGLVRGAGNCYSLYFHSHQEVEISVVLSGEYLLECEGRLFHMKPADIAVVGPDEPHRDRILDYQSSYELAVLGLRDGSFCLLTCGYRPQEGYFGLPAHTWIRLGSNTMLECLLAEIRERQWGGSTMGRWGGLPNGQRGGLPKRRCGGPPMESSGFRDRFYAYLKAFYLYVHDRLFTLQGDEAIFDGEYELFMRVCQYINANLNRRLSARDICAHFHLNGQYLCRMFHKYTRSTVLQEINHARTAQAIRLLRDPERKVGDIAFALGFEDQYYFSRVFTTLTGMSPMKFRKLVFAPRQSSVVDSAPQEPGRGQLPGTFYKRYLTRIRPRG